LETRANDEPFLGARPCHVNRTRTQLEPAPGITRSTVHKIVFGDGYPSCQRALGQLYCNACASAGVMRFFFMQPFVAKGYFSEKPRNETDFDRSQSYLVL
jgi:hypothetical protein